MKCKIVVLMLIPMLAASIALGQSSHLNNDEQTNVKMLTGVWRAQMDNLPAVDLVLTDEGGSLSGAVLFYLHVRKTVSDSYTSTPGHPEPLFNLRLDGKTLHFQVSHRRAHPPGSLSDPPASFRLELTGPNRAAMVNESEPAGERSPGLVMVRSDY